MTAALDETQELARNDKSVKLDAKVLEMASLVCKADKRYVAEYLSEILRPVVEKDYKRVLRKLIKEVGDS